MGKYKIFNRHSVAIFTLADYNMVIGLGPVTAVTLSNRGLIFFDKGVYGLAEANYNLAIKINPSFFGTYVNRAKLYRAQGKWDQATRQLNRIERRCTH